MRWAGLALGLALLAGACDKAEPGGERAQQTALLDERLAFLYEPSQARGSFDVELADVDAVLIQTLLTGQHDALRRAKMELAADGERGVQALRRLVERFRSDPAGVDYLRNAADALALSTEPAATRLLWELLLHPSESLRIQAMRALLTHPRPESFEPVLQFLASASESYQGEACSALAALDPQRAQDLWLEWIEQDANPQLRQRILPVLSEVRDPALIERVRKLLERPNLDTMTRLSLSAAAARAGDEPALAFLREARQSKNPTERDLAVRALVAAGLLEELSWTLANEERASIRSLALRAAAERAGEPAARALLEQASNDDDPQLRLDALAALARGGAPAAIDQALQMLDSHSVFDVGAAVQLLGEPMQQDSALAQRVWSKLRPRMESLELRSATERSVLIKLLGTIPVPELTQELHRLALASEGELERVRARRFVLMQSVNAGAQAQDALFELWRTAEDATLRLDALEALSAPGNPRSRELLLAVLDDPRASPQELVYVADRLVRIGPAREVAWQLKRAAVRIDDERARQAFQGVLWRWYPAPQR